MDSVGITAGLRDYFQPDNNSKTNIENNRKPFIYRVNIPGFRPNATKILGVSFFRSEQDCRSVKSFGDRIPNTHVIVKPICSSVRSKSRGKKKGGGGKRENSVRVRVYRFDV